MSKNTVTNQKTVYEEIVDEINYGPFSILSDKARDRIMLNRAMTDAFERGKIEGAKKG
jgi:hypothetical protein